MKTYLKYNVAVGTYTQAANIPTERLLNGFTAINVGDTNAYINGILIGPPVAPAVVGDSVSIGGNEGEIYCDRISLSFAVGGANPAVQIIQKYYIQQDGSGIPARARAEMEK